MHPFCQFHCHWFKCSHHCFLFHQHLFGALLFVHDLENNNQLYVIVCVWVLSFLSNNKIDWKFMSQPKTYATITVLVRLWFSTWKTIIVWFIRILFSAGVVWHTIDVLRDVLKSDCIQLIGEFAVGSKFRVAHHSFHNKQTQSNHSHIVIVLTNLRKHKSKGDQIDTTRIRFHFYNFFSLLYFELWLLLFFFAPGQFNRFALEIMYLNWIILD